MREARIVSERLGRRPEPQPNSGPRNIPSNTVWQLRTALVWGGLGFLAGAVFWHLVGFWSFLSEVVLDRTPSAEAAVLAPQPERLGAGEPPVIVIDTNRCTMLTLDRRSNLTTAQPCPTSRLALQVKPDTSQREDLAVLAGRPLPAVGYRTD